MNSVVQCKAKLFNATSRFVIHRLFSGCDRCCHHPHPTADWNNDRCHSGLLEAQEECTEKWKGKSATGCIECAFDCKRTYYGNKRYNCAGLKESWGADLTLVIFLLSDTGINPSLVSVKLPLNMFRHILFLFLLFHAA